MNVSVTITVYSTWNDYHLMMARYCFLAWLVILFSISIRCAATPHYGANVSYALAAKEPSSTKGYQIMLQYDPDRFQWWRFNLYFDGGFSHFWVPHATANSTLNIYSIAPVVRYQFRTKETVHIQPYFEVSLGLAYLNHTRLENRNLGIHFAFQDRAGIGALFGASQQLSLGIHAVHYSNARLSSHNSGVTIPLMLDIGYRFG